MKLESPEFIRGECQRLDFDFAFLTNDDFIGLDYAFYTFYNNSSALEDRVVNVLADSNDGTGEPPFNSTETQFATVISALGDGYERFNISLFLGPGFYTLGFGVLDGDSSSSSALLIDNVALEIPEPSALLGLITIGGLGFLGGRGKKK